jgi:predicted nucleotidyltransferase
MAKLTDLFQTFLSNIEPDPEAVSFAQDAHKSVRKCLCEDGTFKEYVENTFLYGSYKRHTAVGTIKDVDIVVLTNFNTEDEKNTPQRVLRKLKDALARCYDDPENPQYQRRSIRIDEPLPDNPEVEMTLDIIPAVCVSDEGGPLLVPDRELKRWILSHPRGHLRYTTDLNSGDYSGEQYVPLVKIMKWWWKYQCELRQPDVERPKPKGFWVECLTGENFDPEQTSYAEHFIATLESIFAKYSSITKVPELKDQGLPEQLIKTSMTFGEFKVFIEAVNDSLEVAQAALSEEDPLRSSELWRGIFGEAFPLYDEEEIKQQPSIAKQITLGSSSHVEPLRWQPSAQNRYKVRIDTYLYLGKKRVGGINSDGRVISSGLYLKYVAKTNVPVPYQVYWQVVNTGAHALREGSLRGEFFEAHDLNFKPSSDPLVNWESSAYTGKHWIECFIIKDNICVARSGKFYVNINNPKFP